MKNSKLKKVRCLVFQSSGKLGEAEFEYSWAHNILVGWAIFQSSDKLGKYVVIQSSVKLG